MGASFWEPRAVDRPLLPPKPGRGRRLKPDSQTADNRWVAVRADLLARAANLLASKDRALAEQFCRILFDEGATVIRTTGHRSARDRDATLAETNEESAPSEGSQPGPEGDRPDAVSIEERTHTKDG
jgi:hypothetical protein